MGSLRTFSGLEVCAILTQNGFSKTKAGRGKDLRIIPDLITALEERKKRFDANPESGMTWDEVVRTLDEA